MARKSESCYCAFCRSPRRLYRAKHLSWANVLAAALASVCLNLVIWQTVDPRVIALFSLSLILSEIFIQMRWRLSLACPHCGFDPVLYLRDRDAAARKVKDFVKQRSEDPAYYFKENPLLKLKDSKSKSQSGEKPMLSKRI